MLIEEKEANYKILIISKLKYIKILNPYKY